MYPHVCDSRRRGRRSPARRDTRYYSKYHVQFNKRRHLQLCHTAGIALKTCGMCNTVVATFNLPTLLDNASLFNFLSHSACCNTRTILTNMHISRHGINSFFPRPLPLQTKLDTGYHRRFQAQRRFEQAGKQDQ